MRGFGRGLAEVFRNFGTKEWTGTALGAAALVVAVVAAFASEVAAAVVAAVAIALLVLVVLYALWVRDRYGGIYEILTSELTWDIESQTKASVTKNNQVRFIQNNVLAIPDYIWGDGKLKPQYTCNRGTKVREIQEGSRTCVVLAMDRMYKRDEEVALTIKREVLDAFNGDDEWIEVQPLAGTPDLTLDIRWPSARPVKDVTLTTTNARRNKRSVSPPLDGDLQWHGGRQRFVKRFRRPSADEVLRIDWKW